MFTAKELFGIALAVGTVVYTYFKWATSYWKRNGIPYLEPKFPFGNLDSPFATTRSLGFTMKNIYEEFRKRNIRIGGFYIATAPTLMAVNTDVVRSILTKDSINFLDRGVYHNPEKEPLEGHLVAISGQKWRDLRVKLTPTFTSGKMKMMFDILVGCGDPFVQAIDAYAGKQEPVDIKEMLARFTTDIIGSCAFGLECNSFVDGKDEFRKYGRMSFERTKTDVLLFTLASGFPNFARALGISMVNKQVAAFMKRVVKDTVEYREKTNFERNDFMQLLINIKKNSENGNGFTMGEMAAQAFVFFLAGYETSSTAMTFCLYELSRNPDIQSRVRAEVNKVLELNNGKMTYDAIQDMKYLAQVLDEALRMYPPVPVLFRKCTKSCYLEEANIHIPKNQKVLISVLGLHYDPKYFPEPEKFNPDRFSEENKHNLMSYSYLPFGEGPRNCIGLRFGLMQSKVGLALLLKHFEFSVNQQTKQPLIMDPASFVLATEGKMWLNVNRVQ